MMNIKNIIKKAFIVFICCLLFTIPIKAENGETEDNIIKPFSVTLNKYQINYGDQVGNWIAYNDSSDGVNTWIVWYRDDLEMKPSDRFIGGYDYKYIIYVQSTTGKVFGDSLSRCTFPTILDFSIEFNPGGGGSGRAIDEYLTTGNTMELCEYMFEYKYKLDYTSCYFNIENCFNDKNIFVKLPTNAGNIYDTKLINTDMKAYSINIDNFTNSASDPWERISLDTDISKEYDKYYRLDFYFKGNTTSGNYSREYEITKYTKINMFCGGKSSYVDQLDYFTAGNISSVIIKNTQRVVHYYDKVEFPLEYSASQCSVLFDNIIFHIDGKIPNTFDCLDSASPQVSKINVDNSHIKWHIKYTTRNSGGYWLFNSNTKAYVNNTLVTAKVSSDGRELTFEYDTPSIYVNKHEQTSGTEERIDMSDEEKVDKSISGDELLDNTVLKNNNEELIKEQNTPAPIGNGVAPDIELVRSTLGTVQETNTIKNFVQNHKEAIITGGCSLGLFIVYLFVQKLRKR